MLVLSSSLDREVQAHKHFTGATNIYWLNELMRYVRSEGLLNNFRLYPMVARTNYGTGVTVRGLGKLTGNQMTLVNGPTWGASGIAFASASSQYGTIADFLPGGTQQMVFHRTSATVNNTSATMLIAQWETTANLRSFYFSQRGDLSGDPYEVLRAPNGNTTGLDVTNWTSQTSADTTYVLDFKSTFEAFQNKTSVATDSITASLFNSSADITINCFLQSGTPAIFADQTAHATAFLTGSVTTTQRETITDLINAL